MPPKLDPTPDGESAARPRVPVATILRPWALGLAQLGIDSNELFAALGLPLDASDGRVPDTSVAAALLELRARHGIEHLGLELAQRIPLGWFGKADYCFSTSATLADALRMVDPHQASWSESTRWEFRLDGDTAHIFLVHLHSRPPIAHHAILAEYAVALVVRRFRDVLGDRMQLSAVRFGFPAPRAIAAFESFFAAPVFFDAATEDIAFHRDLLAAPLVTADPEIARVLKERQPNAASPPDPFLDTVRAVIAASLADGDGALGVDVVAAELEMSGRSLQRKLKEHDATLSTLIDETRRRQAESLLANEGILLCDVAYRLGFATPAAFFRAFRRWTGTTPRAFQSSRAAKDDAG
jgi:AraC-like DNA-binding protein